jgi:hypothetical protein
VLSENSGPNSTATGRTGDPITRAPSVAERLRTCSELLDLPRPSEEHLPRGICVPSSGYAIVSMMTPLDPSDRDWCCIGDIVREIISERLDGTELRSNELPCTMASAQLGAAEITAD